MMRRQAQMRWLAAGVLLVAAWVAAGGQRSTAAPARRPVMATRLYTGADGQTHIDQVPIVFHGSGAEESDPLAMKDAYWVRAAPGYFENWHNADKKRYIVVLSGEAEVTTTGGEKASIVPGRIYIAADLTGKGHTFRVVGNQEWVALFANLAQ
jgi:uncharacterized cupin superfamily protein